jgi:hypothetical protein
MAGPGNIIISVGAETAKAVAELGHVNKALDSTASSGDRMSSGLKAAALPAAAALTALSVAAVSSAKAAMEDQAVHDRLVTSLQNTTNATQAQIDAVGAYIDKTELATGVSDDQLSPAFATLARATGDTTEAQKLMNIALDVSAATGKDVESVSNAMAKGHEGQTAALAKLVPGLSEAARKSKDFDVILAELADTTGGAMANSAATAEGQMRRFNASVDQLQEALGSALLPIMQTILPLLTRLALFAQDNATAIQVLAGIVAVLSAGILAANVALKAYESIQVAVKVATAAWTAAQWLLNAALDANPIGVVTLAIAALAAGLVIAYKKSATFREIVQGALAGVEAAAHALGTAFDALVAAATAAFDWIVAHWQVALFAFGPIGAAIALIATNWDRVSSAASAAADAMRAAIDSVIGALHGAIDAVEGLISALGRIHVPDIHLPHIPGISSVAYAGAPGVTGYGAPRTVSSPGSGPATVVNVYGAIDPEGTARTIRRILDAHERRQGRTG